MPASATQPSPPEQSCLRTAGGESRSGEGAAAAARSGAELPATSTTCSGSWPKYSREPSGREEKSVAALAVNSSRAGGPGSKPTCSSAGRPRLTSGRSRLLSAPLGPPRPISGHLGPSRATRCSAPPISASLRQRAHLHERLLERALRAGDTQRDVARLFTAGECEQAPLATRSATP